MTGSTDYLNLRLDGMTIRDYFAAAAVASAYAALDRYKDECDMVDPDAVALVAYEVADAMLDEREKESRR
jgi:hypothetical protein